MDRILVWVDEEDEDGRAIASLHHWLLEHHELLVGVAVVEELGCLNLELSDDFEMDLVASLILGWRATRTPPESLRLGYSGVYWSFADDEPKTSSTTTNSLNGLRELNRKVQRGEFR